MSRIARCRRNESVSHRGVFVIGAPCSRSAASQYLYGIARDAEAVAREIARKCRTDLLDTGSREARRYL